LDASEIAQVNESKLGAVFDFAIFIPPSGYDFPQAGGLN
jgi:hypothetical protein